MLTDSRSFRIWVGWEWFTFTKSGMGQEFFFTLAWDWEGTSETGQELKTNDWLIVFLQDFLPYMYRVGLGLSILWPPKKTTVWLFPFSDKLRFCIISLFFHSKQLWKSNSNSNRSSLFSCSGTPRFWLLKKNNMLRFCYLSLFFMLNYHRTIFPVCFGHVFNFRAPGKEKTVCWVFVPYHLVSCWT